MSPKMKLKKICPDFLHMYTNIVNVNYESCIKYQPIAKDNCETTGNNIKKQALHLSSVCIEPFILVS